MGFATPYVFIHALDSRLSYRIASRLTAALIDPVIGFRTPFQVRVFG